MTVTHFQRRAHPGQYSIERVFAGVREQLPTDISCRVCVSRFTSQGILRRLYNIFEACFRQGNVNHVTGDVHFLTLLLCREKTLLTIHDCVSLERLKGIKRELFKIFWYSWPIRHVRFVSTVSESAKAELLRHVRCESERILVIPSCISHRFTRQPGSFNAQSPRILQIGTAKNKNLFRLVAALGGIRCHLRIIGALAAEQEQALTAQQIDYSASANLSEEEIRAEYGACDMVVLVSTYEGFGLPIVEANASGRPVVTSNILSMPEVAAEAACLVDPFNVDAIRAGISRVINDNDYRSQLIERGYANARRFSAATVASQYAELYRELATGESSSSRKALR
jgi:glycosyltransferase involved in cell wall biosynthesis